MSCHSQGLWTRRVRHCTLVLESVSGPGQRGVGADVEGPAPGLLGRCMKTWAAVPPPGFLFTV